MNFPTPGEASHIRLIKHTLEKEVNSRMGIFGPYEKRVENWYVSGGCIASLLRGENPNDFDIYFRTKETMDHVVTLIKASPDLMQHVEDVEEKYREFFVDGKCITENAITMKNGLQFIVKHYGNDVRQTFDFVHCMPMYSFDNQKLIISEEQYKCCLNKILKVNNESTVTKSRIRKFEEQGYTQVHKSFEHIDGDNFLKELFGNK